MGRGRKPLATALKEQNGAFQKDPQRRNHQEPKPEAGRPDKPKDLDHLASKIWDKACDELEALKVLTKADGAIVEHYARNASVMKQSQKDGPDQSVTWHKCMDRHMKIMSEMGLTMSARTRLKVATDEVDMFEEFMKKANQN